MKFEVDVDVDAEVAAKVEGLETALVLTGNSREWNRKRVLELEDELERYHRAHVCTASCRENAHVAFTGKGLIKELETKLAQSEQRERELEAQNQRLTEYANAQEARHAEENEQHRRSIAARDSLLQGAAATVRRVQNVVWTADLDRLAENRGVPAVVHELADLSAAAICRVRAFTGQPA